MSDPKDKRRDPDRPAEPDDSLTFDSGEHKRSGRAAFDDRGNAVWEWQLETGVYSRDVNTQRLRKLELDELSIADTGTHPQLKAPDNKLTKPSLPGGGFNPYDNSSQPERGPADGGRNPYDPARNLGRTLQPKSTAPAAPPPRKPTDMRRLSDWIKLRRKVQESGDDVDPPPDSDD